MPISKRDAAKEQLSTAIWMYFEDRNPISIHTLAMAAGEIIEQLCKAAGVTTLQAQFRDGIRPEHQRMVIDRLNEARNFFKHASWRNPDQTISDLSDDRNLFSLLFAADGLRALGDETLESQIFRAYITICFPDMILNPPTPEQVSIFGDMRNVAREEQKKLAYDALYFHTYGRVPD